MAHTLNLKKLLDELAPELELIPWQISSGHEINIPVIITQTVRLIVNDMLVHRDECMMKRLLKERLLNALVSMQKRLAESEVRLRQVRP